ncbi:MAG: hypothetical protein PHQ57_04795 [Candidatus Omnitrophica bacterium]|nr:hypothetical protein [Candidatus Omnitrophota bacterium]
MMKKSWLFICALLLTGFMPISLAYASKTIHLDQAKIRVKAPAGQTAIGRIEIKNPSDSTKKIRVYAQDWIYTDALGAKDFFPAGTKTASCAKWISFVPAEFTIAPSGKEYLQYTVRVPPEAKGGYYAVLFFESLLGETPKDAEAMAVVPVAVRVGSLITVEVEGTVERAAQVENLTFNQQGDTYKVEADFTNTGNADIIVAGNFNIVNSEGVVFARGEFPQRYTLPQDKAKLVSNFKANLVAGKYDLIITLDLGKSLEELGMGRGPLKVLETTLEVGQDRQIINVGQLR